MYYLANDDINKAVKLTRSIDDESAFQKLKYAAKMLNLKSKPCDDVYAFHQIGQLKSRTDQIDTNLIYEINCHEISGKPLYVFKTSKHALELGLKMDDQQKRVNGKKSILMLEPAFFDGMHKCTRGFKTLTLWVHHLGMWRMRHLATMDVEKENKDMVVLFFQLFNKVLAEYKGEPGYKFNLMMICCDEAGANWQAIREVYSEEFYKNKVAGCQWHFIQCAEHQLHNIDPNEHKTFMDAVHALCKVATVTEYK